MAIRSSAGAALLLLSLMALLSALVVPATALGFTCNNSSNNATCDALIDYVVPNTTTLANISSLFTVSNFYNLLGANSYALSTPSNQTFTANGTIKIPFPCRCSNGTGISDNVPVYTVVQGDGLDYIARNVYSGLVTYQEIAEVNNISNPNLIEIGQKLWIPLPCSCDKVEGDEVLHYGHVVVKGSSVEQIADEYGTTTSILLNLNGMSDTNELQAGQVLDVPLEVCTSLVTKQSEDYPLLVANGTYSLTFHNCVQCSCQSSNNLSLHCQPSGLEPTNMSQCPSMECSDGLLIGNSSSASSCVNCAYAGYYNTTVYTALDSRTCSAEAPSSNYAPARIALEGSSWSVILVTIHLGLLCFALL